MTKRKRKAPDIEVIKLANMVHEPAGSFDLLNLSEADVRALNENVVPEWMQKTAEFWCRDNPKPSDVMPKDCDPDYGEQRQAS